jgi:hypothetical protein
VGADARATAAGAAVTTKLEAVRVLRNPWITAASCLPWALIPVLFLLWAVTGVPYVEAAPRLALVGALAFAATWTRRPRARHAPVEVEVGDALRIGDVTVPRARIKKAELLPGWPNPRVRVGLRGRPDAELIVDDEPAAHGLMTALGFDASQTTAKYTLMSLATVRYRFVPFVIAGLFIAAGVFGGGLAVPLVPALVPFVVLCMIPFYVIPATVVVGMDAILVRWLWTRELVPTADILGVGRFDTGTGRDRVRGVELRLRGGRTLRLPVSSRQADERAAMIQKRIEDVVALARSAAPAPDEALVLTRGDLALRDWIGRLKALGAGATDTLRTAAVVPDRLWRVAADPAQPAAMRAAAAVALSPTLDEPGRARLAEVARSTAAPKLRVALERAASDASEEELEEALREMEA